jgi:DNA-directed RNA polymerase subunit RPC12/RpoP
VKNMTVKDTVLTFVRRVRNNLPRYNMHDLAKAISTAVEGRRGTVTENYIEAVDKLVDQPWPYELIKKYANNHPFLRIVHGAIIREVVRNRWDVKEKFSKKCTKCGQEFTQPVDQCPDCGAEGILRDPNPQEKKRLEAFLKDPNRDDEFVDIVKSVLRDSLAVDDWYLSMIEVAANQWAIYVEDAAEMFICATKQGRLGNGVWFCPKCWKAEQQEKTYNNPGQCEYCGGKLLETSYVQKQGGSIKARFGRDEIIHTNSDTWLPKLYGNSKVVSILTELRTALAMSNFNFDTYSKGVLDKLVVLKGEEQSKAAELAQSAKEQREKVQIDPYTGRIGRQSSGSLWIGSRQGADVIDVMPDPEKMQSLDWMEFWFVKIVGGIYGVQPIMMNAPVRGPGGYFQRMQIVVQNDTTLEYQTQIEDALNENLLPKLEIHDWQFKFNEVEARDEMEDAQIYQVKIAAGTAAVNAGLSAELTDEGQLKISGTFAKPEFPSGATHVVTELPKPPAPPTPKTPQPFSQEKIKKGKSWIVTEVDRDSTGSKGDTENSES